MNRNPIPRQSVSRALALAGLVAIAQVPLSTGAHGAGGEAASGAEQSQLADPAIAASNPLSDAGTSGYHLYQRHCRTCHGHLAQGTEQAARLTGSAYSRDHRSRESFHEQFRYATHLHARVARGTRNRPGPKFNDIELIAKFLREVEAWHAMLEQAESGN